MFRVSSAFTRYTIFYLILCVEVMLWLVWLWKWVIFWNNGSVRTGDEFNYTKLNSKKSKIWNIVCNQFVATNQRVCNQKQFMYFALRSLKSMQTTHTPNGLQSMFVELWTKCLLWFKSRLEAGWIIFTVSSTFTK